MAFIWNICLPSRCQPAPKKTLQGHIFSFLHKGLSFLRFLRKYFAFHNIVKSYFLVAGFLASFALTWGDFAGWVVSTVGFSSGALFTGLLLAASLAKMMSKRRPSLRFPPPPPSPSFLSGSFEDSPEIPTPFRSLCESTKFLVSKRLWSHLSRCTRCQDKKEQDSLRHQKLFWEQSIIEQTS